MIRISVILLFLTATAPALAKELYSHDASGIATSGSLADLRLAVEQGQELAVRITLNGNQLVYRGVVAQHHTDDGGVVCLMTRMFETSLSAPGTFTANKDPWSLNFCTDGTAYVKHPTLGSFTPTYAMTWTASGPHAIEVLRNDKDGNVLSGTKATLIEAVNQGRQIAVKIEVYGPAVYRNYLAQVHGGKVCLMTRLNAFNMTAPGTFSVIAEPYLKNICTDGNEYVKNEDPNQFNGTNFDVGDMTWYVLDAVESQTAAVPIHIAWLLAGVMLGLGVKAIRNSSRSTL